MATTRKAIELIKLVSHQ